MARVKLTAKAAEGLQDLPLVIHARVLALLERPGQVARRERGKAPYGHSGRPLPPERPSEKPAMTENLNLRVAGDRQ